MLGSSLLVAAALAAAYVAWQPPSADLFAQTFRSDLFASHGFVIWDNSWYDGLYVPSYSLLFPPLGALLGPAVVGALAAVASAGLFALLARDRYGDRAWLGSTWFGFASASMLFSGRLTFALGIAVGLAALVAAQRRRLWLAGALAALTSFASPVAGLFVAIVGRALSVTGD